MSVRGEFAILPRGFVVADNVFYEVFADGSRLVRGTVVNDSLLVTMAATPQQLLLASGGIAYVFNLQTNVLTAIPGATFAGLVNQVAICSSFFIVTIRDSKAFYVSGADDATDWVTNGEALIDSFPDNIISVKVVHQEINFKSATTGVWYYPSGNVFPFDVVQGTVIDSGTPSANTDALLNNTVFWLGSDPRGQGKVYFANGYAPQRVSNFAVELAIQSYARIDDSVAFSYQEDGHEFYVMYFPTPSTTWVYDVLTGMWHERDSWDDISGTYKAARYQCHMFIFGRHLVGDWATDLVYEMHNPIENADGSWSFATDNGALIHRLRRAPHISNEQQRQEHAELQLYVETGLGPVPPLPGDGYPVSITLQDSSGQAWDVNVTDIGVLTSTLSVGMGGLLLLNGVDGGDSWQIQIDTVGVLTAAPAAFSAFYPGILYLQSASGVVWQVQVSDIGVLLTTPGVSMARDPKVNLRWSNDGAHSWSNYHTRDCGQVGQFKKRVRWTRLGMPRDRVYEISMTDPIGWRIVDAYLNPKRAAA